MCPSSRTPAQETSNFNNILVELDDHLEAETLNDKLGAGLFVAIGAAMDGGLERDAFIGLASEAWDIRVAGRAAGAHA